VAGSSRHNILLPAWQRLAQRFVLLIDRADSGRDRSLVTAIQWKGLSKRDMLEPRLSAPTARRSPTRFPACRRPGGRRLSQALRR